MLEGERDARIEGNGAGETRAKRIRGIQLGNRAIERRFAGPTSLGPRARSRTSMAVRLPTCGIAGSVRPSMRQAAPPGGDDPIDRPGSASRRCGAVCGRAAEEPDIRGPAARPGDRNEQLRRRLIETEQCDLFAWVTVRWHAERAEAVVVLRDVCQLENRIAHGSTILLFTSSTTREDAVSASTSIFTAARLQAIAP